MKYIIFFLLIWNILFFEQNSTAQFATLKLDNVDISCYEIGEDVHVPVVLESITPGYFIIGFDFQINFDPAIITWKGSLGNPFIGIANINPALTIFSNNWYFIGEESSLFCSWNDPTFMGSEIEDGEVLFEIVFILNQPTGGLTSPIDWNENSTNLVHNSFGYFYLNTEDGSLFTSGCYTLLELKVFLEGAFSNGQLSNNLNLSGLLPLQQPFNSPPWNYGGSESVNSVPNDSVIDWVLIELRESVGDVSTADSSTCFAKQACFLLSDGTLISTIGDYQLYFPDGTHKNLYVVVWHRNHINIISSEPLNTTSVIEHSYDFTDSETRAYGGSFAQKEIAPNIWGMISADGNGDTQISIFDKTDIWEIQSGQSGYKNGDFNLDGEINNHDKNEYWFSNMGSSSFVPK